MSTGIDMLELKIIEDYRIPIITPIVYPRYPLYPREYNQNSQTLTELKKVPCCIPCANPDPGKRRYKSNAARIAAAKMKILTCEPDSSDGE